MMLWDSFDLNEIYVLIAIVVAYAAFFFAPKKFPRHITIFLLLWGFTVSTAFDFTIGGGLLDFYKVNDSNQYELTDLLTYFLFAPFSYFFIYFYERFHIGRYMFIPYILLWTSVGLIMEMLSKFTGVIKYQGGYNIGYSIIVFLIILTFTALYYEWIKYTQNKNINT